jgi:UDP-glucose 4-epimerase
VKIAVLGGTGFIGLAVLERLLRDGHEIRVLTRTGRPPTRGLEVHGRLDWTTGDFTDAQALGQVLRGVDQVIHLVSSTGPKSSNDDPAHDVSSNLLGTLQLLEAMKAEQVRRIVFVSSGGTVYGSPQYLPVDECHPTDPQVSYGVTKLAIEKFLLMYRQLHRIEPVILRVSNPYGERQKVAKAQGAVGVFLHRALHGLPIEIWGDGSTARDYIHVSDVAEAVSCALVYRGAPCVFNIATGEGTSLNQLIQLIEQTTGRLLRVHYREARAFDVPVSILDNTLAGKMLRWSPRVSLRTGIQRTARWMEARAVPFRDALQADHPARLSAEALPFG